LLKQWSSWMNPFNPQKILLWRDHLKGCADGDYLPPIIMNVYSTNLCNHNCWHCINWGWREKTPASMPEGHLLKLANFCKEWGQAAVCYGGGEATLHPDTVPFFYYLKNNEIQLGTATNGGSHLTDEKIKAMAECSTWVGVSVDAGEAEIYSRIHGVDKAEFGKVLNNIEKLSKRGADVTYKMLIHPAMIHTIYRAAKTAKELGATGIQMRPVGWINVERTKGQPPLDFKPQLPLLHEQVEKARELEDDSFKVYCVLEKFGEELETIVRFSRCRAAPLSITAGADGWFYNCCDVMDREWNKLCPHYPEPREVLSFWNSQKHKRLVQSVNPDLCPRCTLATYQEIIEKVIIEDRMMANLI